jgi:hypothetical protein
VLLKDAEALAGGLSNPSKMPGHGYSLPAKACVTGSKLHKIKGTVCRKCYALRGHYRYRRVREALEKRLASLTDPLWEDAMVELISARETSGAFRWHDSGDLQGVWHLERICRVCERTPEVRHYLPTREYRMVRDYLRAGGVIPSNLVVRLSAHLVDGPAPEVAHPTDGTLLPRATVVSSGTPGVFDKETGAFHCPATLWENTCNRCRACWKSTIPLIAYPLH